jgi:5-methylcytosine-specific restriction endonuclease McrA
MYKALARDAWEVRNPERVRALARSSEARRKVRIHASEFVIRSTELVRLAASPCTYCGRRPRRGETMEIEHVIPLARGGRHSIGNLASACRACNRSKGPRLVIEWKASQAPLRPIAA